MAPHGEQQRQYSKSNFDFVAERKKFLSQVENFERTFDKISLTAQQVDQILAEIDAAKVEQGLLLRQLDRMMIEISSPVIPSRKYPVQKTQTSG